MAVAVTIAAVALASAVVAAGDAPAQPEENGRLEPGRLIVSIVSEPAGADAFADLMISQWERPAPGTTPPPEPVLTEVLGGSGRVEVGSTLDTGPVPPGRYVVRVTSVATAWIVRGFGCVDDEGAAVEVLFYVGIESGENVTCTIEVGRSVLPKEGTWTIQHGEGSIECGLVSEPIPLQEIHDEAELSLAAGGDRLVIARSSTSSSDDGNLGLPTDLEFFVYPDNPMAYQADLALPPQPDVEEETTVYLRVIDEQTIEAEIVSRFEQTDAECVGLAVRPVTMAFAGGDE